MIKRKITLALLAIMTLSAGSCSGGFF